MFTGTIAVCSGNPMTSSGDISTSILSSITNIRSRFGENNIGVGDSGTVVYTGISDKRSRVDTWRKTRSSIDDIDDGAVGIHFPVSNSVEPVPREYSFTGRSVFGECELDSSAFDHAATNDRVDDLPGLAEVVRHGELTRSTTVSCGSLSSVVVGTASGPGSDGAHCGVIGGGKEALVVSGALGQRVGKMQ
jgi:hypothetical protein